MVAFGKIRFRALVRPIILAALKPKPRIFLVAVVVFAAACFAVLFWYGFGWIQARARGGGEPGVDVIHDGVPVPADARQITFDGGKIRFSLDDYPRLGGPDAKHVVVELYDYQCISCRVMSGYVKALVEAHPGQVAVILVPVPMDGACNPFLRGGGEYDGSCEISRIALSVWRVAPDRFARFHEALMADPSESMARDLASAFLEQSRIDAALQDKELGRILEHNIRVWQRLSGSSSSLPKLLISDRRILHGMPASRSAFLELMKQELSLE